MFGHLFSRDPSAARAGFRAMSLPWPLHPCPGASVAVPRGYVTLQAAPALAAENAKLFDLQNSEYRWNELHHELTQLPYLLEQLPQRVEEWVDPFLCWRRASSPRNLQAELLDGSIHVLRREGGWTRRPDQEPGEQAPTERMQRELLRSFFGFVNLSQDHEDPTMRGLGIPLDDRRLAHSTSERTSPRIATFRRHETTASTPPD